MDNTEINTNKDNPTMPIVSIIVATYRRDAALEKALESLQIQTYEYIEIVVVDDNADDEWNQKVSTIIGHMNSKSDKPIIYIKNEGNYGSAETRNRGIGSATGEYISFLDDDDLYLPHKIKNQVEHMMKAGSDYSITNLNLYNENDKLVESRNREYIKENSKSSLLRYHLMHHMTGTDTMMFKKDYFLQIGGFPPIDIGDEYYLMIEAIQAEGIFSYLPTCDVKAYVHTETDGLSSGEKKIKGEKVLFNYKKKFFNELHKKDIQYIKMRHFAVLAFAELRRRNLSSFIKYSFYSFFSSPINCIKLFVERK